MASRAGGQSAISDSIEHVPGLAVSSLGVGCVLMALEADRLPVAQTVDAGGSHFSAAALVALLAIAAAFALLRRRGAADHLMHAGAYAVAGAVMSASILAAVYYPAGVIPYAAASAAHVLMNVCGAVLLMAWAVALTRTSARDAAVAYGLALLFDGVTYVLTAFLVPQASGTVIALLPLASAGAWAYCRALWAGDDGTTPTNDDAEQAGGRPGPRAVAPRREAGSLPGQPASVGATATTLWGVVVLCYSIVFGQVHYQWTVLQSGADFSLTVQLGAGTGVLLAAAAVLLVVRIAWSYRTLVTSALLVSPVVLLALYLSVVSQGTYAFLYLVLLNLSHKTVLFLLVLMAPWTLPDRGSEQPFCAMYLAYFAGITASSFLLDTVSSAQYAVLNFVAVMIVIACGAAGSAMRPEDDGGAHEPSPTPTADEERAFGANSAPAERADDAHADEHQVDIDDRRPAGASDDGGSSEGVGGARAVHQGKMRAAATRIANEFDLTKREEEVLELLARGYNAASVSQRLVISTATAKTHMRSIYAKLGVHSQQELLDLVSHNIDEGKERSSKQGRQTGRASSSSEQEG